MPDNATHTTIVIANPAPQVPLQPFFTTLLQNGFSVTPEQMVYAESLVDRFSPQVANEQELCAYLSPLFARNEEEQLQFAELFAAAFIQKEKPPPPVKKWYEKLMLHLRQNLRWYTVGLLLLLTAAGIYHWHSTKVPVLHYDLALGDTKAYEKEKQGRSDYQVSINEPLEIATGLGNPQQDTGNRVTLQTRYDWGDRSAVDSVTVHRYSAVGLYQLRAYIRIFYSGVPQYSDTIQKQVKVCGQVNRLFITNAAGKDSFAVGEKIQLRASITGAVPGRIVWGENEDTLSYAAGLDTVYQNEGKHTIGCAAIYDSVNSPCTISNNTSFTVYNPHKPIYSATIAPAAGAQVINIPYRVRPVWYKLLGGIALIAFVAALVVAMRSNNRKAKQQRAINAEAEAANEARQTYEALLESFKGKKKQAEIPFRNKNYLPVPETELTETAVQMRRRIHGGAFYLDIPKTVGRAIRQGGYFEPVYLPRLQQNEYLVLVEASNNNSQMLKLFDYLTDWLKKHNVFIEKYYYRYEPKDCYSATEPAGISLEKLSEKYSRHTLLLFGNAYQLLYPYYPVFDAGYSQLLSRWENKAVITPVPLPDWTEKEKAGMLPGLPVLPVDVPGLLQLMPIVFGPGSDVLTTLQQHCKDFYGTEAIDFADATALERYCSEEGWAAVLENSQPVNVLFQWMAALAVYPRMRWELTLAIGKAILDKYGQPEALNFTTLLRVARIQWMKEGRFPDKTRLELLKRLIPENEVVARETVLALLEEIPVAELDEKHFAWQEKEIQRITNEFILYAYNPEAYALYKRSEVLFARLLAEKNIKDVISRLYLKNGEPQKWTTLISKTNGLERTLGVPLEAYFAPADEVHSQNITPAQRNLIRIGIAITFLSVLGLVFLFVLDLLHTARFPTFMWKPPVKKEVQFHINAKMPVANWTEVLYPIPVGVRVGTNVTNVANIATDSVVTLSLLINDSLKQVSVSLEETMIMDTTMRLGYNSYNISLAQVQPDTSSPTVPPAKMSIAIYMDKCLTDFARYQAMLQAADSNFVVTQAAGENRSGNCNYYISWKAGVSDATLAKIEAAFRQTGINLITNSRLVAWNTPEQVRIYSVTEKVSDIRKPAVYIQYNKESPAATAFRNRLSQCLTSNFTVLDAQYKPNLLGFYRNEIRYYRRSFLDSIKLLQTCLKQIYPDREFIATQINGGQSAMDASAKIWIYDDAGKQTPVDTLSATIQTAIKQTLNYGDEVTMGKLQASVGPFVQNSKGEVFFLCFSNSLPAIGTSVVKVSRMTNPPAVGQLYSTLKTYNFIGLVKVSPSSVNTGKQEITDVGEVAVGRSVYLYTGEGKASDLSSAISGKIIATNLPTTVGIGNYSTTIANTFTTTLTSDNAAKTIPFGNLIVDENNKVLGIMILEVKNKSVFLPISIVLDGMGVKLLGETNNQSPIQAN